MKNAYLTGITGQVGSYLAEILLDKGYKVYGMVRRSSSFNTQRIEHIFNNPNLELIYGDLSDSASITSVIGDIKPDHFYNLACQSHVKVSFDIPEYSFDTVANGVLGCLEAVRKVSPKTKFLTSSSSEMFGVSAPPQNENTPFQPCSPYAVGKVAGHMLTRLYREAYGLFSCSSICFNMESPRRGETFVTKKITRAATRIKLGLQNELILGNLDSCRSWQHAYDGAMAMNLMLEADSSDDYVICATEMYSVKEFVELVFSKLGLNWLDYVKFDSKYLRPKEVPALHGDSDKIRLALGWVPKYSFEELVDEMIAHDIKLAEQELLYRKANVT
jgi:GDPmannose 4,6-dehydratase